MGDAPVLGAARSNQAPPSQPPYYAVQYSYGGGDVTLQAGGVLSTGGGSVLRSANRQHLRDRGSVVYLRSSPEELFRRLRNDVNRPLLQVADPLGRLRDLYVQRDPLYRETAHFIIETGRPSVSTLVNMIGMQLELSGIVSGQ